MRMTLQELTAIKSDDPYAIAKLTTEVLRLRNVLAECEDADCPVCGADTRKRYDCKYCPTDHLGGNCYRMGEHFQDCEIGIIKKETLP